mmetsp:Transcript_37983/g.85537  ORF Transcript_37983/g.85537 Transcript_37983/m.85537 type:complete len:748 (-) Transcript_37983:78-2321(-)
MLRWAFAPFALLAGTFLLLPLAEGVVVRGRQSRGSQRDVEEKLASDAAANPIRRVVTLLQSMAKKVEEEGQKEVELYEKYVCHCKTFGGSLEASIAESNVKVPQVAKEIEQSEATVKRLKEELKSHQEDRSSASSTMDATTAQREGERKEFLAEEIEYKANLAALAGAIGAVEKGMTGQFLQTGAGAALRRAVMSDAALEEYDRQAVIAFLSGGSEVAETYVPKSTEVLGILKQIEEDFSKSLADITTEEDEKVKLYEEMMAAKKKQVQELTDAIERKTAQVGDLQVSIVNMQGELTESEAALLEDKKFFADLQKDCGNKTAEWDERKKLRTEELLAIHQTIKILNEDDALDLFKKTLPSPSFVQMVANDNQLRSKALDIVRQAKSKKGSDEVGLNLIAMALHGKKVNFDKVLKLIDDLVEVLAKEQQDDDHKKEYCEKTLDKTDDKKKELEQMISDLDISIDDETETIKTLTEEIKALTDGIAALDKQVTEATETRKEEHEAYLELMQSDSAAKELLGIAKNRLNKFYNPALYKPPPKQELTDEEQIVVNFGGTPPPTPAPGGIAGTGVMALVQLHSFGGEDVAPPPPPEAFAPYAKKAQMSNGVLAMIDMLVADLDKEMTEAEADEKDAQVEYESLISDSAAKRAQDSKAVTDKEGAKADAETALQAAKDSDSAKKSELMATEEYMAGLHSECDWLLKNFELRKEARAGEIESLKAAKAVLAGADYSFVQQEHRAPKAASLRGRA